MLLILFVSYIVGFAIDPIGKFLYKNIGKFLNKKLGDKRWPIKEEKEIGMFISDKYVLIREFSPVNFKYIEKWNMYCTMSHNFSVLCGFLSILSIFKILKEHNNHLFWITALIVSVLLFLVFLYKAALFSKWARDDINSTISMINSNKKIQIKK